MNIQLIERRKELYTRIKYLERKLRTKKFHRLDEKYRKGIIKKELIDLRYEYEKIRVKRS